jgi:hypothetical protein
MLSVLFPFVFAGTFVFLLVQAFRMMSLGFSTQSINRSSLSKRRDRTGLLTTHPELLDQHGDFISEELLVVRFPELGESEPTPA